MKKSAFYSDVAFAFLIAGLPALCYFRFLRLPLPLAILCAALIGLASALFTAMRLKKKYNGLILKKSERVGAEKLALHLAMLPPKDCALFLLERSAILLGDGEYRLLERQGSYFLESENDIALCRFQTAPLTLDDTFPLFRILGEKQRIVLCDDLTGDALGFVGGMGAQVKKSADIFCALKKENALPQTMMGEHAFDKKRKKGRGVYLARGNSRRCLTSGALLLLSSLIAPFPTYYRIFGAILLLCALLLRLYGIKN